jgi:hypothetical protein
MTRTFAHISLVLALLLCCSAQSNSDVYYAESFRRGPTRISEESFEVKLSLENRDYRERIKDKAGNERYLLTIMPQGPEGDNKITSWRVKLVDLHHRIFDNVLRTSQDPSSNAKDNLWNLEPGKYAAVPVEARRIIKVDSFYVVLQVAAHHFTPVDSPYLDSMTVRVRFGNSDPRTSPP